MMYTSSVHGDSKEVKNKKEEVIFEFYLLSYSEIIKQLEINISSKDDGHFDGPFDHNLTMDLDHLWVTALKILSIFEEAIFSSYPGLRFDRLSMCPSCEIYSFLGEWNTPKELQKNKIKTCKSCEESIDCSFLVKPTTGQSTGKYLDTLFLNR